MRTTHYRFASVFTVTVPAARLWDALVVPETWLKAYPDVEDWKVTDHGDQDHLGQRFRVIHRASAFHKLRYDVEVVTSRAPDRLGWRIVGDIVGAATWELEELDDVTDVRMTWEVGTTKWWMNLLAPLFRRLFVAQYKRSMGDAVAALAEAVGGRANRLRVTEGKSVARSGASALGSGVMLAAVVSNKRD